MKERSGFMIPASRTGTTPQSSLDRRSEASITLMIADRLRPTQGVTEA